MPDLQSLTPVAAGDIEMLYIVLAAVFMPGLIGLLLELIALWLPDDGDVLSEPIDDPQHEPNNTEHDEHDWRHAA